MIGGSADLTGSNNTRTKSMKAITASDFSGRFINYGIREHGMAAAMNGMTLHGGIIPYSGTFLVFSDYCRPAIRLAALMGERVIHVMTHDSIGLGEDGPTHQPVEHLAALRAIPNLQRVPALRCGRGDRMLGAGAARQGQSERAGADPPEPAAASDLLYLRITSAPPAPTRSCRSRATTSMCRSSPSGSEVAIAVEAAQLLNRQGKPARVVSVPCFELFLALPPEQRHPVIGGAEVNVAVEAGIRQGWDAIIGSDGVFVGMSSFGASAPYKDLYSHFGITPEAIAAAALAKFRPR